LRKVPRPLQWVGFRLLPSRIEFWEKKKFRLHERLLYVLKGKKWKILKLFP